MSAVDISAKWIMDDLYHMYGGTDEKAHARKIKDFHVRFNKSKKVMKKHFKKIADAKKTYATNPKENTTTSDTTTNSQAADEYDSDDSDDHHLTNENVSSNTKPLSIQEMEEMLNAIETTMTRIRAYICKYQHMTEYFMPRKVEEAKKLLIGFQQKKEQAIVILNKKKEQERQLWADNKEKERLYNSTLDDTFNDLAAEKKVDSVVQQKTADNQIRALHVKKPVMKLQTLSPKVNQTTTSSSAEE